MKEKFYEDVLPWLLGGVLSDEEVYGDDIAPLLPLFGFGDSLLFELLLLLELNDGESM